MYLVMTFLVNYSIFATLDFFLVEKKIDLVRGKESRRKGSKRDEKGQKKIQFLFTTRVVVRSGR
jgi:hypothetical protein